MPRIPTRLHDFLRLKERRPNLKIDNNWGDVIPYYNCTILQVYGTRNIPHVLPRDVPLRIGFLEVMWQLEDVEDNHLFDTNNPSFFLTLYSWIIL